MFSLRSVLDVLILGWETLYSSVNIFALTLSKPPTPDLSLRGRGVTGVMNKGGEKVKASEIVIRAATIKDHVNDKESRFVPVKSGLGPRHARRTAAAARAGTSAGRRRGRRGRQRRQVVVGGRRGEAPPLSVDVGFGTTFDEITRRAFSAAERRDRSSKCSAAETDLASQSVAR